MSINKQIFLSFVLVGGLCFSVAAQSVKKGNSAKNKSYSLVQAVVVPGVFDPKKPLLTQQKIDSVLKSDIQEKILKFDNSSEFYLSSMQFNIMMRNFSNLLKNPELPEVTKIPLSWFKEYEKRLLCLKKTIYSLEYARNNRNTALFEKTLASLKIQQKDILAFLEQNPPRLTSKQLAALRQKNSRMRKINYENYQKDKREKMLKPQRKVYKATRKKK